MRRAQGPAFRQPGACARDAPRAGCWATWGGVRDARRGHAKSCRPQRPLSGGCRWHCVLQLSSLRSSRGAGIFREERRIPLPLGCQAQRRMDGLNAFSPVPNNVSNSGTHWRNKYCQQEVPPRPCLGIGQPLLPPPPSRYPELVLDEGFRPIPTVLVANPQHRSTLPLPRKRMPVPPPPHFFQVSEPSMDLECASGCTWSTARAPARLWDSRPRSSQAGQVIQGLP